MHDEKDGIVLTIDGDEEDPIPNLISSSTSPSNNITVIILLSLTASLRSIFTDLPEVWFRWCSLTADK